MNIKLLFTLVIGLVFWGGFFVALTPSAFAVSIAEQTQAWSDQLNVFQVIQELGNNLSGTAQSFTFRIRTSKTNLEQFDYTAQNSKIYDKDNNNSYIIGCIPTGANPADRLRGLTFTTNGVPAGFEDVTIDFSCRNYNFIPGHRYLIKITNANIGNQGSGQILFAAAALGPGGTQTTDFFTSGGLRYANGNIWDYYHGSGACHPENYIWGDITPNPVSGCHIWTSTKDDLYFILSNTSPPPPPPKLPVVFIPGIGGSEMKASQDIIWSTPDGHGGTYSHAYTGNEKVWVNQDKAAELGDDDYFDVLRLKADGQTPEAALSLTGDLTSFGYSDIDSFFSGMGYEKGKNFFIFPYDWRKDVRATKDSLDTLIETAKGTSGQSKVNLVVHSMGGLVARYYISDAGKAVKVNKLIELGVPHLGAPLALKTGISGIWITADVFSIKLGVIPPSEIKDVFSNLPSIFQLLPSRAYYDFYTNSHESLPYPFFDERDIDNDKVTGPLNFNQIKNLLTNLGHNMPVFNLGEQFHDFITPLYNQNNGVKIYIIGGTGSDTLGQIHETWLIKWPIKLVPITDEIKIDGDETVPIYSAIPRNNFKDLTGATKVYYVVQEHADMPRAAGISMQTVKAILNEDSLPVEVKDQKIELEGKQVSVFEGELDLYDDSGNHTGLNDKGEIETNIPDISFSAPQNSRHAFIKKSAKKIKIKITSKKKNKINAKIRHYTKDKVEKTTLYKDIPITETAKVEFSLDATTDISSILALFPDSTKADSTNILPTSEVSGPSALDQTPPTSKIDLSGTKDSSGKFTSDATVTLTGSDADSGILRIEYSLDNGQTVQVYSEPFTISTSGKTTLQVKSIDKLGNEEIPQEVVIEFALSNSNSSDNSSSSDNNSSLSSTADTSEVKSSDTSEVDKSEAKQAVLGISTAEDNPSISTDSELQTNNFKIESVLSGLLIVSGGIVILASLGLAFTFLKPTPK